MKRPLQNDRPGLDKVKRVTLSEDRLGLRVALFILMLAIVLGSLGYGLHALLTKASGLQEIPAQSAASPYAQGLVFYYDLGAGEASASADYKALRALYSKSLVEAMHLFDARTEGEEGANLASLNAHPNQWIALPPALYQALVLLEESGTRYHFLAPAYETYQALFASAHDGEAALYDPWLNPDLASLFGDLASWIKDPAHVSLELVDGAACLRLSDAYLAFARANDMAHFIDLFWLKQAFVLDYLADRLLEEGYSYGTLVSSEGFVRHLDGRPERALDYTLSQRQGQAIQTGPTLHFSRAVSLLYLHDYPLTSQDTTYYYVREGGGLRFPLIDPADGLCKAALPEMAASSSAMGLAPLALKVAPLFIADQLDPALWEAVSQAGIDLTFPALEPGQKEGVGGEKGLEKRSEKS